MSNVKVGDLAMIVNGGNNSGKIGKVLRPVFSGEIWVGPRGERMITSGVELGWWVDFPNGVNVYTAGGGLMKVAPVQDRFLRPVSGLPMEDDTTTDDKIPAKNNTVKS